MNLPAHNHASSTSSAWDGLSWRLAYLTYLGTVALCSVLAFVGLCRGEVYVMAGALMAGILAVAVRSVLRDHLQQSEVDEACEDEFCSMGSDNGRGPRAGELVALLKEWDGLERKRGSAGFDPWALQTVRSEIRSAVHENPALEQLFRPGR
jgi:hypothetical protein